MYIIQKEAGVYQIFTNDRIHIGSTIKYAEIRDIIDDYYNMNLKKQRDKQYWATIRDKLDLIINNLN